MATKSEMCGQKFELKIDNVRFVGHPTLLQHTLGQVRAPGQARAPGTVAFGAVEGRAVRCLPTFTSL